MPLSCSTISPVEAPFLRAREMSRPSASVLLEAQPPALPMLAKTSRGPYSSSFMMTNSLPQPVSMRCVSPLSSCGETQRRDRGCGRLFGIMNDDEDGPREVFANMGKAGGCASSNTEALGRLISLALKKGASAGEIVEQLKGIRCHVPYGLGPNATLSCADAIGKALERRYVAGAAAAAAGGSQPQLSVS